MLIGEWFKRYYDKTKMRACFRAAGLTLTRTVGKKQHVVEPIIHSVRYFNDRTEFVFTLQNGTDPKLVRKNEFVFRQYFGTNTRIKGDLKKFVVNVYKRSIQKQLDYKFVETGHRLPIICGINRLGSLVTYDMAETPHLMIAGETRSGKSTQLRSVLTQLILSRPAEQLRLVLGDLKMSEFHVFRNIKHVDAICYNADDLAKQLGDVSAELERRGQLLNDNELTHISELASPPPIIIVCVDEFAMLRDNKTIMKTVENISAIGRALDVYLILSQQRADREVMGGRLKQNLTVRMAFRHADAINSRITIGSGEAADIGIEDRGRFYLKREELEEIQGPYLTVEKAKELLKPFRESKPQQAKETEPSNTNDPLGLLGRDDTDA